MNEAEILKEWIHRGERQKNVVFTVEYDSFVTNEDKHGRPTRKELCFVIRCNGKLIWQTSADIEDRNGRIWHNWKPYQDVCFQNILRYLGQELIQTAAQIGEESNICRGLSPQQYDALEKIVVGAFKKRMRARLLAIPHKRPGGGKPQKASPEQLIKIAESYGAFLKIWKDAQAIYKDWFRDYQRLSKKECKALSPEEWKARVRQRYPNMPDELLNRLADTNLTKYERIPSSIAAEHVARFAGIPDNTCSYRDIRRYVKAGRQIIENIKGGQIIRSEMAALSIQITSDSSRKDK